MRAGPLLSPALSPAMAPNTSAIHARVRAATPGELELDATEEWKRVNERTKLQLMKEKTELHKNTGVI